MEITSNHLDKYTIGVLKKEIKKAAKMVKKWETELEFKNMLLNAKLSLINK